MEIVAILATVILLATLVTLIFAFAAYFVTKAKRKNASKQQPITDIEVENVRQGNRVRMFFEIYLPHQSMSDSKGVASLIKEQGLENNQWT